MRLLERAEELMNSVGVRAFQDYPLRWRVSPDVGDALLAMVPNEEGYTWTDEDRLFGFVIDPDAVLPPNSMMLVPA